MKKKQCDIFGERLAALRNKKGFTQSELADNMRIQRVTIAKYETGQRAPSIDHLINFAEYFQVSTDYLLGLAENATTDTNIQAVCAYTGLSEKAIVAITEAGSKPQELKNITEWFLSDGDISMITALLSSLQLSSEEYKEMKEKIKKRESYLEEKQKTFSLSYEEEDELNGLMCELDPFERDIDIDRYRAIKYFENILNHFDVREQEVFDNGKHNPKKE